MKKSVLKRVLGFDGRLISGSKGQYRYDNPTNVVVFNGNVCTESEGKIWYGDFDVTVEEEKLKALAKEFGEKVYLLYESDARFENEAAPKLDKAVFAVDSEGQTFWDEEYLTRNDQGRLVVKPVEKEPVDEAARAKSYLESEVCRQELYNKTDLKLVWSDISRLSKKKSPLEKFWNAIQAQFGNSENLLKTVRISCVDMDKLKKAQRAYIDKYFDFLTDYRKENELSWGMFMYGPDSFLHDPVWVVPGYVYMKKGVDAEAENTAA